ncbi:MAG: hypothetical protein QMD97_00525 [Candidatus Aenigmarchaeota archaeon]|nr:hypothetical protein [Candidatus Aenigmarchaeota archaeon]
MERGTAYKIIGIVAALILIFVSGGKILDGYYVKGLGGVIAAALVVILVLIVSLFSIYKKKTVRRKK